MVASTTISSLLLLSVIVSITSTSTAFSFTFNWALRMAESSSVGSRTHPCAVVPNPPPTKTASAVIFDIDGTLVDSWKLGYDATVVVLRRNDFGHVPMDEELYHATCVYPTPERLARTAGLSPQDDDFESVGAELGRQFDDHYVELVGPQSCALYDGIREILQDLPEETRLGALTNACVAYGHAVLKANCQDGFALYERFGTIHGADSVPAAKPSPEGLLQCALELGVNPEDCIYVGDAIGDGKAARAAGMVAIGVLWGSNSKEKLLNGNTFDYLCSTREELRDLLPEK